MTETSAPGAGWIPVPAEVLAELEEARARGELPVSPAAANYLARAAARRRAAAAARAAAARDPYWAGLRPSMIREYAKGASAWTSVDLVEADMPGGAIRAALEPFGVRVNRFPVGRAQHLVNVLSGEESTAPFVILAVHGDEGRLVLPELAEEIAATERFAGARSPDDLRGFVDLPGRVVIALGCETGTPELARAFLDGGCAAYVAPEGAPFGYASVFAPVFLFYELTEMRSLEEAVARLRRHDPELAMWRLFR